MDAFFLPPSLTDLSDFTPRQSADEDSVPQASASDALEPAAETKSPVLVKTEDAPAVEAVAETAAAEVAAPEVAASAVAEPIAAEAAVEPSVIEVVDVTVFDTDVSVQDAGAQEVAGATLAVDALVSDLEKGVADTAAGTMSEEAKAQLAADARVAERAPEIAVSKVAVIVKALHGIQESVANIIRLLDEQGASHDTALLATDAASHVREIELNSVRALDGRVVEGVFDGRQMVGSDGKSYTVPPNYASKSKLVEGDMLKLTITQKGTFIFKQIGPIERNRVVGALGFDQTTGEYYATDGEHRWSVLKASVTFYKGEADDEVVLLVPKEGKSTWAAVENIVKRDPLA